MYPDEAVARYVDVGFPRASGESAEECLVRYLDPYLRLTAGAVVLEKHPVQPVRLQDTDNLLSNEVLLQALQGFGYRREG